MTESKISQFYEGKTVFITGGTGFIGKVLIEKLLRSTKVSKIYVLMRDKKGKSMEQRFTEMMREKVFDIILQEDEKILKRVIPVKGDIVEECLGLESDMLRLLIEEVNIVFHSAATVRFDDLLTKAVPMNVESVVTILNLCKRMKKLEVIEYVSTAYSNLEHQVIKEEVYAMKRQPQDIINLVKNVEPTLLNSQEVTNELVGPKVNTYCFTKALGESAVELESSFLPAVIVR